MCRPAWGLSSCPHRRGGRPFRRRPRRFPSTVPRTLTIRVHSLVRLVLFGVPSSSSLPVGLPKACPARVRALCATLSVASTSIALAGHRRGSSQLPLGSVLRFSRPIDGLLRHPTLRACFIPLPRTGFGPSRVFSRPAALPAPRRSLPPCRCRPRADRSPGRHTRSPRLRGVAPRIDAFSGGWCLAFPRVAPLFGFRPPSGSGVRFLRPIPRVLRS